MRGGTAKGLYFLADDLPAAAVERDDLLLRVMVDQFLQVMVDQAAVTDQPSIEHSVAPAQESCVPLSAGWCRDRVLRRDIGVD
jgi:hypothetical protein